MFGLEILDVIIGLVTVYLAFGIACTALVEAVLSWFRVRSRNLETALKEFFNGDYNQYDTFIKAFYDHPLIKTLSKGKNGRPSYIPTEIVGQVVESLLIAKGTAKSIVEAIDALPNTYATNQIKALLNEFATRVRGDTAEFRKAIETHFDATMERASGWFKRYTQNVALLASALLVIGANVDTIELVSSLYSDPAARIKIVEIADQQLSEAKAIEKKAKTEMSDNLKEAKKKSKEAQLAFNQAVLALESAGLKFGWKDFSPVGIDEYLSKIIGLVVSILAVSLGAPFWFSVLQRFMQVRSSLTTYQKSRTAK